MPGRIVQSDAPAIRPFRVDVPEEVLEDLHRRVAATRLPSGELVGDRSQGVQLATAQELVRNWAADYDWRRCEARLNALPQFKTEIDGVHVHFIHVKSRHEGALALIMTHGWPGSVIELLEIVGQLTDPTVIIARAQAEIRLLALARLGCTVPGAGARRERSGLALASLIREAGRA